MEKLLLIRHGLIASVMTISVFRTSTIANIANSGLLAYAEHIGTLGVKECPVHQNGLNVNTGIEYADNIGNYTSTSVLEMKIPTQPAIAESMLC